MKFCYECKHFYFDVLGTPKCDKRNTSTYCWGCDEFENKKEKCYLNVFHTWNKKNPTHTKKNHINHGKHLSFVFCQCVR